MILPFLILSLVGIFTHYSSFSLAIYGDEWLDIYQFLSENDRNNYAYFSPLPGILKYLSPWGPSFLILGNLYQLFGTNYLPYFIVSFLFRLFASYVLYVLSLEIGKIVTGNIGSQVKSVGLLIACFFLISPTGLQTTDWAHYMNIYLAVGFYLLSTYYQIKFYQSFKYRDLRLNLFFTTLTFITGSVRMFPLIFAIPLMDFMVFLVYRKDHKKLKYLTLKFLGFLAITVCLWGIGLFGGPFSVYSYGGWSFSKFFSVITSDPLGALGVYLHWVGVMLMPDGSILGSFNKKLVGLVIMLCIAVIFLKFVKAGKYYLLGALFGCGFLIFLSGMWYYNPLMLIDSSHRYLLVIFTILLLFIETIIFLIIKYNPNWKRLIYLILIFLIFIHLSSTRMMYNYWLEYGRSSKFIGLTELRITHQFNTPIETPVAIYLDADDARVAHGVIFGLGLKIMVLSQTWDSQFYPVVYDDLEVLRKETLSRESKGWPRKVLLDGIYGYQIRDKQIIDISKQVREALIF